MQIRCELKLLAQFCFNLNTNFEVQQVMEIERIRAQETQPVTKPKRPKTVGPMELKFTDQGLAGGPGQQPLKEGVRDMLIKHNLFSWDL